MRGDGWRRAVLACALAFVSSFAPAMARAAGDGLSAATWHVPEPDPLDFTGADEAGFWTAGGERIGLDGKRDLKLRVPPGPPNEVDNAATVPGPKGPVFAEGIRDGARRGLFVGAYDQKGENVWALRLLGETRAGAIEGPDGLFPGEAGDALLAGKLSGCFRFAPDAKPICADERALARNFDCEGGCDGQPFVTRIDARGNVAWVLAPPGYPATHFSASRDGPVAWGGDFKGQLDLDPDPHHTVLVAAPHARRPGSGPSQAFWALFDARREMRWLSGWAIVGPASASLRAESFSSDSTLIVVSDVNGPRRNEEPDLLTDGTTTTPLPPFGPSGTVVIMVGPSQSMPVIELLTKHSYPSTLALRLLASRTNDVFASFGDLPARPDEDRPGPPHPDRTVLAVYGAAKGWRIRVPNDVEPTAVVVRNGKACFAFTFSGPHDLSVRGRIVRVGGTQADTSTAIGCYDLKLDTRQSP